VAKSKASFTQKRFNTFCAKLPAATHVVQWGGHDVWKVGGKVFAIGGEDEGVLRVSFKVTPIAFEMLKDTPGCIPAPYLASRGMTWIQAACDVFPGDDLCAYLTVSHQLVAERLTKKARRELGFD
jgi:predicted DNA-binding protein (MmcQ/YjbR family)